jgi:hypothetical protein
MRWVPARIMSQTGLGGQRACVEFAGGSAHSPVVAPVDVAETASQFDA